MRIIFVCTGNTCRSPMAEKMFSAMVGDESVEVLSRGVMCTENMPMNLNARAVMLERGLPTSHKSKAITREDIDGADIIITMTDSHKRFIEMTFGESAKIHALGEVTGNGDVIDPYGGDIYEYRRCARRLEGDLAILKDRIMAK